MYRTPVQVENETKLASNLTDQYLVFISHYKMPRVCAAPGCSETATPESRLSFHKFPKDQRRKKEWACRINRVGEHGKLWMPKSHDVVCSKHFLPGDFTLRSRLSGNHGIPMFAPELTSDAVPSVFEYNEGERKRHQAAAARRAPLVNKRRRLEPAESAIVGSAESETATAEHEASASWNEGSAPEEENESTDEDTRHVGVQAVVHPSVKSTKQQTNVVKTMTGETQTTLQLHVSKSSQTLQKLHTSTECQTDPIGPILRDGDEIDSDSIQEDENPDWQNTTKQKQRTQTEDLHRTDPFAERKYIVCEGQLELLLSVCRVCAKPCQVVKQEECGTSVEYTSECECGFTFTWVSQPYSRQMPLVNLAAATFTACSATRLLTVFSYANIARFSRMTFNKIQGSYLVPAVRNVWQKCQDHLFLARGGKTVKVAGDGRCDSPGHCAKYCSYTLLDAETAEVVHVELVQSNQVRNSHAMELEGLKKSLDKIKDSVSVSHLITDRHASIKQYMRDHHSSGSSQQPITHRFDVLHMAKGVGKKLDTAGKSKRNACLSLWCKGIKRHMYWCSTSTPEGPNRQQEVKDKWLSMVNHIADIHEGHGGTFPSCLHGPLEPRAWIRPDTCQHRILKGIICSRFLLRDIGMLSPDVQTASLESYHAVVCHFAPKLYHFTYSVMESKLLLAAIHFNANAGRKQAVTDDGDLQWKIARPKSAKGAAVPIPVNEKQSRNYITDLFEAVTLLRLTYPSYKRAKQAQQEYNCAVPPPLSHTAPQVDKATVVAQHRARMNWATTGQQSPPQSQ